MTRLAALVVCACMTAGCSADAPSGATPAESRALRPVTLPDLSRTAPDVQAQLRDRYAWLQRTLGQAATDADRAAAYGEMGKLLLATEYLDAAELCFTNAATLHATDARWPYFLGHVARLEQDPARAVTFFERASALRPDDLATLLWLAEMRLLQNRPEAAERLFARAQSLSPDLAAAHDGLGRAALARRNFGQAVGHLERARAAQPDATRLHYTLALAYRGLGDRAKADAHLRQRGDVDVTRPDPLMQEVAALLQNAAAYELRAARALEERRWPDAVASLRTAIAMEPGNAVAHLNLGNALYQSGDSEEALGQFQIAVKLAPGLARAQYALGVLMDRESRDREAIDAFGAAVSADEGFAEARLALAEALRRTGRLADAVAHYDRLLETDPDLSQALFGSAMAHIRMKRYARARDLLESGVRRFPDQPGFPHALARVLAAAPDDTVRNGARALTLLQSLMKGETTLALAETTAMALAEVGRFDEAIEWQQGAVKAAAEARRSDALPVLRRNLSLYEQRRPCRRPWEDDDPVHRPRVQ